MSQSLVGITLKGRYEIISQLGAGGFGDTYLAYDRDLPGSPKRVVKHLSPKGLDPQGFQIAERLFKQEAELLYKLGEQHDQIPFLYAYFQEDEQFYLVQEFIEGHDLTVEMPSGQKYSEDETLKLLDEILSVLSFVHENGVIHRDIKPQNIMRRERDGKLFLIDFGAVKEINVMTTDVTGQTSLTVGIGSPGFMPNEQANGRPKLSSDVYAVGMIAVNCLTGVHPSQLQEDTQTGELLWQHLAQVSERTGQLIQTMVNDHFRDRFQTATVAHRALSSLMGEPKCEQGQAVFEPVEPTIRYEPQLSPPPTEPTQAYEPQAVQAQAFDSRLASPANARSIQSRRGFLALLGLGGIGLGGTLLWSVTRNRTTASLPAQTFSFNTVRVDERGNVIERINGSTEYFAEDLGNGVTLDMVMIPGGTFSMGSPDSESERDEAEGPQHEVSIQAFAMGKYAVTQAQWDAVMERSLNVSVRLSGVLTLAQDAPNKDTGSDNPSKFKGAYRPVDSVTWNEAVEFCQRLSQKTGREYRLPSEAEWEYACRAETITPFNFGETITTELANYRGTDIVRVSLKKNGSPPTFISSGAYGAGPMGKYRAETTNVNNFDVANSYGLFDMHGNVWEWCSDFWHDNYQGAPIDGSPWEADGDFERRIMRGGSWLSNPKNCRSATRFGDLPSERNDDIGFRLVLSLPQ